MAITANMKVVGLCGGRVKDTGGEKLKKSSMFRPKILVLQVSGTEGNKGRGKRNRRPRYSPEALFRKVMTKYSKWGGPTFTSMRKERSVETCQERENNWIGKARAA